VQLGRVAQGDDPVEDRKLDHRAITVKELCARYFADLQAGLILGKGGRPKRASTIVTDTGRIERHIVPLIGTQRVKDLTKSDINKVLKDIMAGKTRVSVKTKKLRGRAVVRGGAGTASRTVGLLGGILTYAVEAGIIETNPAHGIRKPKDKVRKRRLSEAEYRTLGRMLRDAAAQEKYATIVDIVRQLAWEWACLSVALLSSPTVDACWSSQTRLRALSFKWSCTQARQHRSDGRAVPSLTATGFVAELFASCDEFSGFLLTRSDEPELNVQSEFAYRDVKQRKTGAPRPMKMGSVRRAGKEDDRSTN
jgi:hypothetical protein